MDRFLARFATLAACASLVLSAVLWLRLRERGDAPRPVASAAGGKVEGPAAGGRAPDARPGMSGPTYDEVAHAAESKIAEREEKICAAVWPRVLRANRHWDHPPAQPKTIDALLNLLLSEGDSETADAGTPENGPTRSKVTTCRNNLKQLGVYVALFESKFKDEPQTWEDLRQGGLLDRDSERILACPFDPPGTVCSYEFIWAFRGDDTPPDAIIGYDRTPHEDGKHCVLFFQGRVDLLSGTDLRDRLAKQRDGETAALSDAIVKARKEAADTALSQEQHERALKRLSALQSR